MKKILIFIDWFLPGYKAGGPTRSYANLIDHFKGEYQFYIVTRNTDYTETKPYPGIKSNSWTNFDTNVFVWYCSQDFIKKKNLKNLIQQTDWDVLYINGIYSWYFSILPLLIGKKTKKGKIIVSVRGMLKQSAVNVKQGKKKLFIKSIRRLGWYRGITLHATNEDEKQDIIQNFGQHLNIHVAPNLPRKINGEFSTKEKKTGTLNLISIARISPEKNTLYALEILKRLSLSKSPTTETQNSEPETRNTKPQTPTSDLQSPVSGSPVPNNHLPIDIGTADAYELPTINFELYGSIYNPQYWDECQKIIENLPNWINVTYHGTLDTEKVFSKLSESHFLFMPTRGENFGHVILESLSAGCPVIISDQTPWKNLAEKSVGWDIDLTDEQKYVEVLNQCISMEQIEYDKKSKASYQYASQFINDKDTINSNRNLFT